MKIDFNDLEQMRDNFKYSRTTGRMYRKVNDKWKLITCQNSLHDVRNNYYVSFIYLPDGTTKKLYVHRIAWFLTFGYYPKELDHANRNKLDNRLKNLRISTGNGNRHNCPPQRANKFHSPYKGVGMNGSKYIARCAINGQRYWLGLFTTQEEAALAYNVFAKKHHGEFAYLNKIGAE